MHKASIFVPKVNRFMFTFVRNAVDKAKVVNHDLKIRIEANTKIRTYEHPTHTRLSRSAQKTARKTLAPIITCHSKCVVWQINSL